ncbi:MAG: hypothetical protein OQL27_11415 [Sedimenticola sp.]|nr:hypothetical protein [Sedimenticola sp.]
MIEVSKILLLVLGELFVISIIVTIVFAFLAFSKRQRDRASVKQLVARIKEDGDRREQETRKVMEERFGFAGADLEAIVKKIVRNEKAFYQVLIDVYLKRNTEAVPNLSVDYESSVDTYRTLEIPRSGEATAVSTEDGIDSDELMLLKEENQRLTEELQVTMDTMGRMLSEYSLMFSGGGDSDLDKEKMRDMLAPEMSAAEAGAESSEDVAAVDESLPPEEEAAVDAQEDEGLKALDEELAKLDLSEDELSAASSLDETVVVSAEESDEVVDLDDVLDDPDQK